MKEIKDVGVVLAKTILSGAAVSWKASAPESPEEGDCYAESDGSVRIYAKGSWSILKIASFDSPFDESIEERTFQEVVCVHKMQPYQDPKFGDGKHLKCAHLGCEHTLYSNTDEYKRYVELQGSIDYLDDEFLSELRAI